MVAFRFHIEGQVQGVGFRPFVYQLAQTLDLKGWVSNDMDGVHIEVEGKQDIIEEFVHLIQINRPKASKINAITKTEIYPKNFHSFSIKESGREGIPNVLITPDLAICPTCKEEIASPANRRHEYPFTTCTDCGPRFSILKALPYDRKNTSMEDFPMCRTCEDEYHYPLNRRFFSQTNSCRHCTIHVSLFDASGKLLSGDWEFSKTFILEKIADGKIISIKGIGGYLLLCNACDPYAVNRLREKKRRPTKPFALVYPNLEILEKDTLPSQKEKEAFTSIENPIVLLKVKQKPLSGLKADVVAPGLDKIGAMLPNSAMIEVLQKTWAKPLVATSANISGSPIIYEDNKALNELIGIADFILCHDREILIPQDDSVISFTESTNQKIFLRRSRGFAPTYSVKGFSANCILAMGADLKSTFTLQVHDRIYTSQYLGDLQSFDSQKSFKNSLFHLLDLCQAKPEKIVVDAHPGYFSGRLGRELGVKWEVPVLSCQHHEAHAHAVLAENTLTYQGDPVLCLVWDGTGFGHDGQIWGSEFFDYRNGGLKRLTHLDYFPVWHGDKMANDIRLAALFISNRSQEVRKSLKEYFSEKEWDFYQKLIKTSPPIQSCSMGRLFDAVAVLLGVKISNTYEGEAALHLEQLAKKTKKSDPYSIFWTAGSWDSSALLEQIHADKTSGVSDSVIAHRFHRTLIAMVEAIKTRFSYKKIAVSGGVWQNGLLTDMIVETIPDCEIYFHRSLSPNDENISLGQLAYVESKDSKGNITIRKSIMNQKSTVICV